ncbi:hypothetical protein ACWGS9_30915 [Bradyrhizobium sp. Arg314]
MTARDWWLSKFPNAFGEKVVHKLMSGAMIRFAERWRAIKVSGFERRQMTAFRQELVQEYEPETASIGKQRQRATPLPVLLAAFAR